MPLTLLKPGEGSIITRVGGKPETRQFLENLGFVVGTPLTVVSEIAGNLIVVIRDTRVAISKEMAMNIHV